MSIDWWTLGFQTVNVAVLVWLLQRFFWRPVAEMIALRRTNARAALDDATATRAKADAALHDIETTRAGFAAEREAVLAAAHKEADQNRTATLADATKAAAALEAAAKTAIEKQHTAEQAAWLDRSSQLAVQIATRLAGRLDSATVRACFLDWLIAAIAALPARESTDLDVISEVQLNQAEQKTAADRIRTAFGGNPALTFKTDPALIAGLELRAPHLVVSNSWRADLATITKALAHGR